MTGRALDELVEVEWLVNLGHRVVQQIPAARLAELLQALHEIAREHRDHVADGSPCVWWRSGQPFEVGQLHADAFLWLGQGARLVEEDVADDTKNMPARQGVVADKGDAFRSEVASADGEDLLLDGRR